MQIKINAKLFIMQYNKILIFIIAKDRQLKSVLRKNYQTNIIIQYIIYIYSLQRDRKFKYLLIFLFLMNY